MLFWNRNKDIRLRSGPRGAILKGKIPTLSHECATSWDSARHSDLVSLDGRQFVIAGSGRRVLLYWKDSRALNCTSRPGVVASVITPNCGVFTKRLGVPKLVWFSALKNSPRNENLARSAIANSRETARSSVCIPGP